MSIDKYLYIDASVSQIKINYQDQELQAVRLANAVNLYLTNGFSHHYQLDESTFILRGVKSGFYFFYFFLISFFDEIFLCKQDSPRWASHLGLCCLPMYHKRDARLK